MMSLSVSLREEERFEGPKKKKPSSQESVRIHRKKYEERKKGKRKTKKRLSGGPEFIVLVFSAKSK